MVSFFLLAAMLSILVGAALKTDAREEEADLHRMSNELMVAGLIAMFFAFLSDRVFHSC